MADAVVHIGENSPEYVALRLFEIVARVEKRSLYPSDSTPADRKYVLDGYAECLDAVRAARTYPQK